MISIFCNKQRDNKRVFKDFAKVLEDIKRDFIARCEHNDHTISKELKEETIYHIESEIELLNKKH